MEIKNKKKILVIDDEKDLLEIISEELSSSGFDVVCASNTAEALEFLQKISEKNKIDLILSDIRMPDGDGIEFFEKVQESKFKKIPFLFMTGFSDISVSEARSSGALAVISKPFEMSELIELIKKHV